MRASRLAGEYRGPLEVLNRRHHAVPVGQTGLLVRRLESFGPLISLVVGAFQEGEKHPGRADESPELDSCQGPLLRHPRQDIATGRKQGGVLG